MWSLRIRALLTSLIRKRLKSKWIPSAAAAKAIVGLDGAYISGVRVVAKRDKTAGVMLSGVGTIGIFSDLSISDVETGNRESGKVLW